MFGQPRQSLGRPLLVFALLVGEKQRDAADAALALQPGVRHDRVSPELTPVLLARLVGIKPPGKAKAVVPEGVCQVAE